MSAYDLTDLLKRWQREELTTEQAIGQILLHLQRLSQRLAAVERHMAAPSPPVGKDKRSREK